MQLEGGRRRGAARRQRQHNLLLEVLVTLWAIWWVRRKAIHEEEFQSPLSMHLFICRYLDKVRSTNALACRRESSTTRPSHVWKLPPVGFVNLNVDVLVAKTQKQGVVGVMCIGSQVIFHEVLVVVFEGVPDSETLKAYVCREARALAEDLAMHRIYIATNYLRVLDDLRAAHHLGAYCMIAREINSHKSSSLACEICHEQHEHYFEAHNIAKMDTNFGSGCHLWFSDPSK